jgi:putative addiction module component (TIGR02574 family)
MPDSRTSDPESAFVCDCNKWVRKACAGEPFYKELEDKRYCVLHFPGKEKRADFKRSLLHSEPKLATESGAVGTRRDAAVAPLKFSAALTYSAGVMTFQKPEAPPATTAAQTVVLLETIFGPSSSGIACARDSPQIHAVNTLSLFSERTTIVAMPLTLDQITDEAIKLPADARALLADKLVQSLESEDPGEIQRLWSAEAIRRRDEIRSGQVPPIPGDQVTEEVRRLVGR